MTILGHKQILHKQPATYYQALMGLMPAVKESRMLADQPTAAVVMPALQDVVEDEQVVDDEAMEAIMDAPSDEDKVMDLEKKEVLFHPFTFSHSHRLKRTGPDAGTCLSQWEAICPFHLDDGDIVTGTKCKRAITYSTPAEEELAVQDLMMWCVCGRNCKTRAKPPRSHKAVKVPSERVDIAGLKRVLVWQLAQPKWINDSDGETSSSSNTSDNSDGSSSS